MRRGMRVSMIVLVVIFSISFAMPVFAAKKIVYVLVKEKTNDYAAQISYTYKFSYDKNGKLKKIRYFDSDKYSYTGSFQYNKKKQVKKQRYTLKRHGVKEATYLVTYKYTQRGYLKKALSFEKNNNRYFLANATYLSWNQKGKPTRFHYYYDDGNEMLDKYKYNKNGLLIGGSSYDSYSGMDNILVGKAPRKNKRIITEIRDDGETVYSVTYQTLKHGNIISETVYGDEEKEDKWEKTKYTYKKMRVRAKDYWRIVKQQRCLEYFLDY